MSSTESVPDRHRFAQMDEIDEGADTAWASTSRVPLKGRRREKNAITICNQQRINLLKIIPSPWFYSHSSFFVAGDPNQLLFLRLKEREKKESSGVNEIQWFRASPEPKHRRRRSF
jgi:hypothetical protein